MSGAGTFRTWHDVRLESVMRGWSQPVDATLYLKGEMECALMGRRFHRGFTAAEKTELWDRWKRGECCVDRLSRHLISGHAVDGTACQVCAISGRAGLIQSTSFIQRTILGQYSSSVRFPINRAR